MQLSTPVKFVKRVGERVAANLAERGVETIEDLLYHLPFRYEDRLHPKPIHELQPGEMASVIGEVRGTVLLRTRSSPIFEMTVGQGLQSIKCMWFHGTYLRDKFRAGQQVALYGKLEGSRSGNAVGAIPGSTRFKMIQPTFEILPDAGATGEDAEFIMLEMGRIVPVYESLGGKTPWGAKLSSRWLRRVMWTVFRDLTEAGASADETLPRALRERLALPGRMRALEELHFPPAGTPMTRDWPMVKTTNEPTDHVHHKGLWFAHGDINGVDFWSEQKAFGKTVHQKFIELRSGKDEGVISSLNSWIAPSGTVICTDERTLRFHADKDVRMIDYEITLIASHGDLKLGDTKEGTMAIRLPATMSVSGPNAHGHILTSEGARDGATWGKRAKWVDYTGPVNGKPVGVALFDSPQNPRYPTWWHVRTYGLFAANPLGEHYFDKKPAGAGDLKIAAGERITFRYRFVFHSGGENAAQIEKRYQDYASPK